MKTKIFITSAFLATGLWTACNNAKSHYVDLVTGEPVYVEKDSVTGVAINAETGKPLHMYVDTRTDDTIYAKTGDVVNHKISRTDDGEWVLDGDYKVKYGGDDKIKVEEGEYKIKHGDYKKEVEKDGDITIKDGDKKIKIDGETGERKVKYDD
jgi:hypothetical protein